MVGFWTYEQVSCCLVEVQILPGAECVRFCLYNNYVLLKP